MAQFTIDPTVENRFKSEEKKMPEKYLAVLKKKDEPGADSMTKKIFSQLGYGFYTLYKVDTLNKKDLKDTTPSIIEIFDIDPLTGKAIPQKTEKYEYSDGENTYLPVFISAELKNDSLYVAFPFIFEPQILGVITPSSVSFTYRDYRKYDSVFRTTLEASKTNEIHLPMQLLHFAISDSVFTEGKTIYGEADLTTPPFYTDASDFIFTSGYLKQQMHFTYLFQLKIIRPRAY
jgi:hypothetical protein